MGGQIGLCGGLIQVYNRACEKLACAIMRSDSLERTKNYPAEISDGPE